jgi:hypothetical protein
LEVKAASREAFNPELATKATDGVLAITDGGELFESADIHWLHRGTDIWTDLQAATAHSVANDSLTSTLVHGNSLRSRAL